MRKLPFLLLAALFGATYPAFAQNPGGVSANLTSWYKADNAATVTLVTGNVSS